MKKTTSVILGIFIIAAGVLFALNALEITDWNLFFDGWWTLLIIVPCAVGLFTERDKIGCVVGVAFGVVLLLACQGVFDFSWVWKLLVPALIVVTGARIVIKAFTGEREKTETPQADAGNKRRAIALFSGNDVRCSGEPFEGGSFTAIFGGIECDLREAVIEKDCAINVYAIFGGVDIFVPENVKVRMDACSIFGDVTDKSADAPNCPTVYVKGLCLFGGVEVKTKKNGEEA